MGLFGGKTPIGTANVSSSNRVLDYRDVPVLSYTSVTLGSSTVPNSPVIFGNPVGLDLAKLRLRVKVTSTLSTGTATSAAIENMLKQLKIVSASGKPIMDMDGSFLEVSSACRNLSNYGYDDPSPTISLSTTAATGTWDTEIPLKIPANLFPITIYSAFNTQATLSGSASFSSSTGEVDLYADFDGSGALPLQIVSKVIGQSSTGVVNLGTNFDQNHVVYGQWVVATADSPFTDFRFTPDGANYEFNPGLAQSFINLENRRFVAKGTNGTIGHVTGMFNLFTKPFAVNLNSNLAINFASAPTSPGAGGASNQLLLQMIESL